MSGRKAVVHRITLAALMTALAVTAVGVTASRALADEDKLVLLGKALFFDTNLSTPPGQACASCHEPAAGFADPDSDLPVSRGAIPIAVKSRNAQSVAYSAFSPPLHFDPTMRPGIMEGMYVGGLFWDGRADTLEEQAMQPLLDPLEMHNRNKRKVVVAVLRSDYASLFIEVFGWKSLRDVDSAFEAVAEAIAAYERSAEVSPFTSKFDYWQDGAVELTDAEMRGYELFTGKARCKNCHSLEGGPDGRPLFTNFGHQNLGTPKNPDNPFYYMPPPFNPDGANYVDLGLGAVLNDPRENGKFKIPSLRNVAVTPPYEHNGVFDTLHEVVQFNNTRDVADWPPPEVPENVHRHMPPMPGTFGQLGLTDQEVDDIVAFLETLTDGYQP